MKHLLIALFLALGIQTQAQTNLTLKNTPYMPAGYFDASAKMTLTAAEVGSSTFFSWTSPFPATTTYPQGMPTWYAGFGLYYGSKSDTAVAVCRDYINWSTGGIAASWVDGQGYTAWTIPVWYKNNYTGAPNIVNMSVPWNDHSAPVSGANEGNSQSGATIVTDGQLHWYYMDLFTMIGNIQYHCIVLFQYAAPAITFQCQSAGTGTATAPAPSLPPSSPAKTTGKPPKK